MIGAVALILATLIPAAIGFLRPPTEVVVSMPESIIVRVIEPAHIQNQIDALTQELIRLNESGIPPTTAPSASIESDEPLWSLDISGNANVTLVGIGAPPVGHYCRVALLVEAKLSHGLAP